MTMDRTMASWAMGWVSRRTAPTTVRLAARWLELRSIGLAPEHFSLAEGCRAALAVGVPLAIAVSFGRAALGWAVFAAFWTCLCDAPGPDRLRRRLLLLFVVCGTLVTLARAWGASAGAMAGMIIGPALVFLSIVGGSRVAWSGPLGTLLAVVGVVAVGFPRPLDNALFQAGAFSAGSAWSYLLINALWRLDPAAPLRQLADAVTARLLDMSGDLATIGDSRHRDEQWHSEHAAHRRAVRLSIERLRGLIAPYARDPGVTAPLLRLLDTAETIFGALIALDQAFIDHIGPAPQRVATARAVRLALLAWRSSMRAGEAGRKTRHRAVKRLRRTEGRLSDNLCIGCVRAIAQALDAFDAHPTDLPIITRTADLATAPATGWRQACRQALRQSAGLMAVYYTAIVFRLGYPYWAAMAVVVVLQGGARVTWTRCLERILGSLLGGCIALLVLHVATAPAVLAGLAIGLAGTAVSLRSVNYTVFVAFLTMLFILVTELLQPGAGIASARMLDNVIGSIAALLAVLLLWPDFGASPTERIRTGIAANHAYVAAVEAARPIGEIEAARRAAGLASTEAEVALHDLGTTVRRFHVSSEDRASIAALRRLAGDAAIAWHRRLAAAKAPPEESC